MPSAPSNVSSDPDSNVIEIKKPPFGGRASSRACMTVAIPRCARDFKKIKKPRVLWLTHSPRPAVRYRPLPTSLLCHSSLRNSQSAIFNQLALKLGLRAHHQPGKSVNTSGLLSLPLNISRSSQPAVRYRPLLALLTFATFAARQVTFARAPALATNWKNF